MTKIFKIPNPLKILQKSRQTLAEKRKIVEQEKLLEALKRPEGYRRRPAMKFASNSTRNLGPK
jgi:hypothetical protein